jgi:hypothetical protein
MAKVAERFRTRAVAGGRGELVGWPTSLYTKVHCTSGSIWVLEVEGFERLESGKAQLVPKAPIREHKTKAPPLPVAADGKLLRNPGRVFLQQLQIDVWRGSHTPFLEAGA